MTDAARLDKVIAHFLAEEHRLLGQIGRLAAEQQQLQLQLDHVRYLRSLTDGSGEIQRLPATQLPVSGAAPEPPKATRPAPSRKAPARAARSKAPARKGRRKAAAVKSGNTGNDSALQDMGIVDAAIHVALKNRAAVVDAGQILDWFEAEGYATRNGAVPNRNSIYVSLNRERHEGGRDGKPVRVLHEERGKFRLPEVEAALKK